MEIRDLYIHYLQHPSIQTDSRKIKSGDLFFALKGPSFNGNKFAKTALDLNAAFVILDEPADFIDERIVYTNDVLATLQDLAKHHRQQFSIPFIAITGSNGKTTTKELIHEVLSTTYKTYTTVGNLNNHIGIPLTILSIKEDAEIAVIEMGANHLKEIESYCAYTLPTHGLITNCGKAHLEGFGGIEGVKKGKGELFEYLKLHDGTAFIFSDYDYLKSMSVGIKTIKTYGTKDAGTIGIATGKNEFLEVLLTKQGSSQTISTNLVGTYNLPNVLAAVAIGNYFNISEEKIKTALEQYTPTNSRSQLIEKDGFKIILDAYNANPTSMKAAIENFAGIKSDNKVLLLGGMMEMGKDSILEHVQLIELIKKYSWKNVVLVGGDFANIPHPFIYFDTSTKAGQWFQQQQLQDHIILIKGSRSMQMEKILE